MALLEESADDGERLGKAIDAAIKGESKRLILRLVPPGAETEDQSPSEISSTVAAFLASIAGA